jgi:hypothetical protein
VGRPSRDVCDSPITLADAWGIDHSVESLLHLNLLLKNSMMLSTEKNT